MSRISQRGINRIKQHERFMPEPYRDQAGYPTIGWGHRIGPGEQFTRIDEAEGERLLRRDLAIAEEAVGRLVTAPLTQNQYDALISFVFNVGAGAFEFGGPGKTHSTILKKLNALDYSGAAEEFKRWNNITVNGEKVKSDGLTVRRVAERDLFVA